MRRPRRWRWWGKWAGTALCLVIAAAWVVSGWVGGRVEYNRTSAGRVATLVADLKEGLIGLGAYTNYSIPQGQPIPRFATKSFPVEGAWRWSVIYDRREAGGMRLRRLFLPLWIPFDLIAVLTAWLWVRDRRFLPPLCRRCGYDLTGSPPGPCPECGGGAASAS